MISMLSLVPPSELQEIRDRAAQALVRAQKANPHQPVDEQRARQQLTRVEDEIARRAAA